MCPKLPLVDVHAPMCPKGSPWCDKPDKKLEKNLNSPIINPPLIRESSLILVAKSTLSDPAHIGTIKVGMQTALISLINLGIQESFFVHDF